MASVASMYIGEWSAGVKQGYGVMDDIKTGNNFFSKVFFKSSQKIFQTDFNLILIYFLGEKYLGSWYNNAKHGSGLIVTLDGIYYEGSFVQDVFTVNNF